MKQEQIVIIGSGPAGLTAALYAARARLEPLVVSGSQLGGQISITSEVENYPGFPHGTTGPELVELMRAQAETFGARLLIDEVTEVDFRGGPPFTVKSHSETYQAKAVIVTMGASPIRLGIPGEEEFIGRGVSFCATCDGFFFRDKEVVVVGGGDSAIEEGIFLTRFANQVQVVHRRDQLRAGEALKRRAMSNEKIDFVWDSVVEEIVGNGKVEAIRLRNLKTGDQQQMPTDGVFIFIGHYPNSSLFEGQLKMDEKGYLTVDGRFMTSVPGVFAAGEIMDPVYRQIATSVGQGCSATMMAERWLREHS